MNCQLESLQVQIEQNCSCLANQIEALAANISLINDLVETNTKAISKASGRIDTLEATLNNSITAINKIQKLESFNKIWQNNFRVINKTFIEIRKKVRFVVRPVLFEVHFAVNKGG